MTVPTAVSGQSNAGALVDGNVDGNVDGRNVVGETGGNVVDATVACGMVVDGTVAAADVDGAAGTVVVETASSIVA